jgi:hypothetical protein
LISTGATSTCAGGELLIAAASPPPVNPPVVRSPSGIPTTVRIAAPISNVLIFIDTSRSALVAVLVCTVRMKLGYLDHGPNAR